VEPGKKIEPHGRGFFFGPSPVSYRCVNGDPFPSYGSRISLNPQIRERSEPFSRVRFFSGLTFLSESDRIASFPVNTALPLPRVQSSSQLYYMPIRPLFQVSAGLNRLQPFDFIILFLALKDDVLFPPFRPFLLAVACDWTKLRPPMR
jgi:hypothetical protein